MLLAMKPERARVRLETLLGEAIEALAALDAERMDELAALAEAAELAREAGLIEPPGHPAEGGPVEWPQSAAEWRRAAAAHCALGHLVDATARQLAVQRRIATPAECFRAYDPEASARRMDRWSGPARKHERRLGIQRT